MRKLLNIVTKNHESSKRKYLERMINNKITCMKEAKKYSFNYWDGRRQFGYGGYKYIPGRWTDVANKIIKQYKLNSKSKILDAGCGKGYLLFEIKKKIPDIEICGFDISKYGIRNSKKEVRKYLFHHDISKKTKFKKNEFDLLISINCLHNLSQEKLSKSLDEISRISKNQYICVESYRNDKELFNLQCWALTCQTFFSKKDWIFLFNQKKYFGDFEFIYFK